MEKPDIRTIFEEAKNNPSLYSTLDIVSLLNTVESSKHNYLENQTTQTILRDVFESLNALACSASEKEILYNKLTEFRHIDELNDIQMGKYIRWIRKDKTPYCITNGGLVVNVKFSDSGALIVCKCPGNRFIQFKMDECLCYQKLSTEELLLLMAYENIQKK
jgi:putative hemolysin